MLTRENATICPLPFREFLVGTASVFLRADDFTVEGMRVGCGRGLPPDLQLCHLIVYVFVALG